MSSYRIEILSPAKVNLHLEVLGKRPDGFHDILSLFQLVSLYDRIEFELRNDRCVNIACSEDIPYEQNLVIKAIKRMEEASGIPVGLDVRLYKEIPIGSGLGGGSSNAAATLLCLNKLFEKQYGVRVERENLIKIALELGSDVPFFLNGCAALVKGRGEVVVPIEPRLNYKLLLVFPGVSVNTREAYGWLDEAREPGRENMIKLDEGDLVKMYAGDNKKWRFFNSFTEVIMKHHPELRNLVEFLYDSGAVYSSLSGTGGCVFGIFADKKIENKAFSYLKKNYKFVKVCKPLERKRECVLKL